jgi:PAS domain S-box-containing protein
MESKEIKILAIDDNKDNLLSLKALISEAFPQATVQTEENGQRGIESAKVNEPEVILLDIIMPGMDGYEVCRRLKSDRQLSDIPVVFVTALKGDKESRIKALEAGGDGFLAKPVDESELTAQIRAMLKIRQATRREKDDRKRLKELVAERTIELRKLSQAIEQSPTIVTITNVLGEIEYVNPKFTEVTGYTFEEARGQNPNILKSGVQSEKFYKELWDTITSGNLWKGVLRNRKKSGELYWESASISPITNEHGQITNFLAIKEDITEQKNTQEEIKITRDTYQSIINSITEAIYIIDHNNIFIDINRGAEKMYGFTREELTGKSPDIVSAEGLNDLQALNRIHKEVAKTGIPKSFEFWAVKKNGEIFPKEVIINKGRYYGKDCLIATARDIAERKRAETAHEAQYNIARSIHTANNIEELLEIIRTELGKLIDTSNFMVALYNPENDTLEKLIYRDEKEDFTEWPAGESLSGHVVKSGKAVFMKRKEIEAFAVKTNIELIGTPAASWIGVPVNIKKKVAGAMVVQSYDNAEAFTVADVSLLEMIAHETGIYLERQMMLTELIASKEKAEESNRLKTAFINNISHEIRTPLNGIIGFGDLIMEDNLSHSEKKQYFKILEHSSNRLQQTITDILDISGITAESIKPWKNVVNVAKVMNDLLKSTENACSHKNILVSLDIPKQHHELMLETDEELFLKIMKQLLGNAEKFTAEGRINLGYDVQGEWIQFHVKDTGQGISDDKLEQIFEPFMQEDLSVTRGHEGSGLGLSIVRGLIEILGGRLWAESKKGVGSTFFFSLPYIPAKSKTKTDKSAAAKPEARGKNLILIAEDEESNYQLLNAVVQKIGFSSLHAIHGAEAVELCHKYPEITLVLMDIKMPVMNGLEATKEIKAFRPDLPIIALTAYAQTGDRQRVLEAGCDEYLAKPVKLQELNAMINEMIL